MMAQLLWRVNGELALPQAEHWRDGLMLHLLHQPLTTVLVRRAGQTRHYLALPGCSRCQPDGCDQPCHRGLFAQLLRTALPGIALIPVARLVSRTSERRCVVATPERASARLLDSAFLEQWAEGRLITTWSRQATGSQPVTVGALLITGQDGPAPAQALRRVGWRRQALASLVARASIPPHLRTQARASQALVAALRDPWSLAVAQPLILADEG